MLHKTQHILCIVKVSFLKYGLVVLRRIYALDFFTVFFFVGRYLSKKFKKNVLVASYKLHNLKIVVNKCMIFF